MKSQDTVDFHSSNAKGVLPANASKLARFAYFYCRLANATQAAIKAGYSPKSAHVQGCRALRHPKVQAWIAARDIDRTIHAKKTYNDMIRLADRSMRWALHLMKKNGKNIKAADSIAHAVDVAGKQLERVARAEGVLIHGLDQPNVNVTLSIQQLIQQIGADARQETPAIPAETKPALQQALVIDAEQKKEGTVSGGNGSHS